MASQFVKLHVYNIGLKIVQKFTKSINAAFSVECLTAEFSKFLAQMPKLSFLVSGWVKSKYFEYFLEIT